MEGGGALFLPRFSQVCFAAGNLELVSKELNHFGAIASFFQDWAPGTLTGGE